jgi:hypothetical protein
MGDRRAPVIARSPQGDEAIQGPQQQPRVALDCFPSPSRGLQASLAMTQGAGFLQTPPG